MSQVFRSACQHNLGSCCLTRQIAAFHADAQVLGTCFWRSPAESRNGSILLFKTKTPNRGTPWSPHGLHLSSHPKWRSLGGAWGEMGLLDPQKLTMFVDVSRGQNYFRRTAAVFSVQNMFTAAICSVQNVFIAWTLAMCACVLAHTILWLSTKETGCMTWRVDGSTR